MEEATASAAAGGSAGDAGAGSRDAYHRRRAPRRGVWWLAAGAVVALVTWLLFPGPPRAEISESSIDFGTTRVGEFSDRRTFAITNRGERRLKIKAFTWAAGEVGQDYELVDEGCIGANLSTGESCGVWLRFAPRSPGDRGSRLAVDSNDGSEPGVMIAARAIAPSLGLAPTTISFGVVPLEGETVSRTVTLSNVGSATLALGRIRVDGPAAGDFTRSRRCPKARLEPGEACTFDIRFKPSVSGARAADLVIDSDALEGSGALPLEGTGLWEGPPLDPSTQSLDLGEQRVGVRSAPSRVTFVNRTGGTVRVDRTAVAQSSLFALIEDGCRDRAIASGESCAVAVTFLPVQDGPASAILRLAASGASEESRVGLKGRGVTPRLEVASRRIEFNQQRVGFESAPQSLRFKNSGTAKLVFKSASVAGLDGTDFLLRTDECVGKPLAPGKSCRMGVGFAPSARGPRRAVLTVDPSLGLDPVKIELSGVGAVSTLKVSQSRLDFDQVYLGRAESLDLALTNDGAARLAIEALRFEGDDSGAFRLGQMGCALDAGLPAGATCRFSIDFEPDAARTYGAELVLAYNGPDSPARVQLVGAGRVPAPAFRISTSSLDLGSAPVGGRGEIGTVVISNPGAAWLDLVGISLGGEHAEEFQVVAGTCDGVTALAPGGSCTVGVRLAPGRAGRIRAAIVVRHGAGSGVAEVALRGEGVEPPRQPL